MARRTHRTDIHFSTIIVGSSSTYSFGLDWRGDARAPLMEGLIAEIKCEVQEPERYARKELTARMMTAPDTAVSLSPGGPAQSAIGHLVWSRKQELTLWLPSDATWWSVVAAVHRGQFTRLAFTVTGPLSGAELQQVYFSGDDEEADAQRVG